jgi:hypothetical protein
MGDAEEFNCKQIIVLYALTSRAQFICRYSKYSQTWIDRAKACSAESGEAATSADLKAGIKMFDDGVSNKGMKFACADILSSFPDALQK